MKKILEILNELHNNKINFCLQSRTAESYYNLKVNTPQGKEHYFHSNNLQEIEEGLTVMWEHLIGSTMTVIETSAPLSVPIPPPMPPPPLG